MLRKAGVHHNDTIFCKSVQLIVSGDIDIIGRTMRDVTAAFSAIERKICEMQCLAVNECKTKYMLSASAVVPRMGSQITVTSYHFDVVMEFIYLVTLLWSHK